MKQHSPFEVDHLSPDSQEIRKQPTMPAKRRGEKKLVQQTPKRDFHEGTKQVSQEDEVTSTPLTRKDYESLEKEYLSKYDFEGDNPYMQIRQPDNAEQQQQLYGPREDEDEDDEDGERDDQTADGDECAVHGRSGRGRQRGRRRQFLIRPTLTVVCFLGLRVLVLFVVFFIFTNGMYGSYHYLLYLVISILTNYFAECIYRYY